MKFMILILAFALRSAGPAFSADGDLPPVLDRIEHPERLTILVIDSTGEHAVGAMPEEGKSQRSLITFYSAAQAEVTSITVPAEVRALLLAREDLSALALLHKKVKRGEGETYLARVDPLTARAKRLVRLPPSAVDLDYWPARDGLLVACRDEIRTLLLPDMRSGPLYRIAGGNRAVASLGRNSFILVGQDEGLLLVDLEATQGREEMPVAGKISLPQPVNTISAADDGSYALVTLADDSVQTVYISALKQSAPPPPQPETVPPKPEPVVVEEVVEEQAPEPPPPEPEPVPPVPEPVVVEEVVEEQAPEPPKAPAQVRGKIAGTELNSVIAVVLLGPNNMLREAARVVPESDGSWSAAGLAPGKYRVQLDGGGGRVLVTDPPFRLIDVKEDGFVEAGDIRLLKAL